MVSISTSQKYALRTEYLDSNGQVCKGIFNKWKSYLKAFSNWPRSQEVIDSSFKLTEDDIYIYFLLYKTKDGIGIFNTLLHSRTFSLTLYNALVLFPRAAQQSLSVLNSLVLCFSFKLLVFPLCNSTKVDNNKDVSSAAV